MQKKEILEEKAKERMLQGAKIDPHQNSGEGWTVRVLAQEAGFSHDTLHKIDTIQRKASEDIKNPSNTQIWVRVGPIEC